MKTAGKLIVFIFLIVLLVTRDTQDMGDRMFWLNEAYDFFIITQPFWDIPGWLLTGYFLQPPLFYWIGHFVARIGTDPLTLRSISLACYVLMIWFVVFRLREFQFATRTFLAFILIMSPFGAYAATEFRPYALAALSLLVSSVLFYRAIQQPSRWSAAVLYGVSALILQYSLVLNAFAFALQMAFLGSAILYIHYKEGLKQAFSKYRPLIIVSVLLCIEYSFYAKAASQAGSEVYQSPPFNLFNYMKALLKNIVILKEDIIFLRSWALSFGPAFLLLGCINGLRKQRWAAVYLILLFAGQLFFSTYTIFSRVDYSAQRHFTASYVAFALLCALGAEYLFQQLDRKTVVLFIAFLLLTTLPGGAVRYAASLRTPGDNPITKAVDALRCDGRQTVVLCDPWRNGFVPWYAYRNDPLITAPFRPIDPYIRSSVQEIPKAASKKYCFILIEGPQGNVSQGSFYQILSGLPDYTGKKYSITPGHVIPDSAWLFTPSDITHPAYKDTPLNGM